MEARWHWRLGNYIVSIPLIIFADIAQRFNFWGVRHDFLLCIHYVDMYSNYRVPPKLIEFLIVAEDRRSCCHFGIDPIGILRAVKVNLTTNGIQGASTIEQQFVRVVTDRYEKRASRKIKEQLLAVALCKQRSKVQIATAYLCVAHYGYRLNGISGLHSICGKRLSTCSESVLRDAVARLKYPEPSNISASWANLIELRSSYIKKRLSNHNQELPQVYATSRSMKITI